MRQDRLSSHDCASKKDIQTMRQIVWPISAMLFLTLLATVDAFVPAKNAWPTHHQQQQQQTSTSQRVHPLLEDEPATVKPKDENTSSTASPLLDWNASGSIGNLLMQMQQREEEMRKLKRNDTATFLDKDQAVDLSSSSKSVNAVETQELEVKSGIFGGKRKGDKADSEGGSGSSSSSASAVSSMKYEVAKELDSNVKALSDLEARVIRATAPLMELPSLYAPVYIQNNISAAIAPSGIMSSVLGKITPKQQKETKQASDIPDSALFVADIDEASNLTATPPPFIETAVPPQSESKGTPDTLPLLSQPEHYENRIRRDMRQLTISIASNVETVEEWRSFCEEHNNDGGILPLLECIREGATAVRRRQPLKKQQKSKGNNDMSQLNNHYEDSLIVASSACRALRTLCGLSPELAAVVTDSCLRANVALASRDGKESFMQDLCTLLRYANDNTDFDSRKQILSGWRHRRDAKLRCKLYVTQLLLAMTVASDSAVEVFRKTDDMLETILVCSSFARKERTKRWLRYPGEIVKGLWRSKRKRSKPQGNDDEADKSASEEHRRSPFIEAASVSKSLNGQVQIAANQILAAMGHNQWVPKMPGQKGLRILCLDGGGARGMASVTAVKSLVDTSGLEISDCFDMVIGTSTGAIIAFLVGMRRESGDQAVQRYNELLQRIFTKGALSTPLMLFTTASYDEAPFMDILNEILADQTMLDSRGDPAVPYVFAVTSKMSSTPTHVALFRNYNYAGGELPDPFTIDPDDAREILGLSLDLEDVRIRSSVYPRKISSSAGTPGVKNPTGGSRHPGSFRVLQRYALRASTAAPTVFKPVMMGGEMYCDGGIVSSNPAAIAIHEARSVFPDVPIELVVSIGTGAFLEQKSAPRIGWDGIIGQIVNSACDGEQIHHILEDILGDDGTAQLGKSSVSNTRYVRFNPVLGLPDAFPIDETDPEKLEALKSITNAYMSQPEQQAKMKAITDVLRGRRRLRRWLRRGD